ncbi:hypothetical protein pdam_00020887 [Pocillopora damicornis]|uniref:Uncharacterized protein n=1 Tax=Pocillopora damicornis TaxID=46731 RepID=A0A3M6TNB7_POCDA|nr:hypothetical protein pdam_00020887 [Pocillopora damicornis]
MALSSVLRRTRMHVLGYLVIAVYLIHLTAISGQTTTAESISNSSTTSTPSTTTRILPSTTTTPIPSSTSTKPTPTTTSAPVTTEPGTRESSRKFDGASFVGGIILGAFLTCASGGRK